MYLLRGLLISASAFVIVYIVISVSAACLWRTFARSVSNAAPRRLANSLYALRLSPLLLATAFVVVLTIPSFALFEPRAAEEGLGAAAIVLPMILAALIIAGLVRATRAHRNTARSVKRWTGDPGNGCTGEEIVVSSPDAPPVALAGIRNAKLLISTVARKSLTAAEMERALAHERAHLRSGDNFKKLVLQACGFPYMAALERAWLNQVELAADADAVHTHAEALDLASALVKIARLRGTTAMPELASGLVDSESCLQLRIDRLVQWNGPSPSQRRRYLFPAAAGATCLVLLANIPGVLKTVHSITEILIR